MVNSAARRRLGVQHHNDPERLTTKRKDGTIMVVNPSKLDSTGTSR